MDEKSYTQQFRSLKRSQIRATVMIYLYKSLELENKDQAAADLITVCAPTAFQFSNKSLSCRHLFPWVQVLQGLRQTTEVEDCFRCPRVSIPVTLTVQAG